MLNSGTNESGKKGIKCWCFCIKNGIIEKMLDVLKDASTKSNSKFHQLKQPVKIFCVHDVQLNCLYNEVFLANMLAIIFATLKHLVDARAQIMCENGIRCGHCMCVLLFSMQYVCFEAIFWAWIWMWSWSGFVCAHLLNTDSDTMNCIPYH